MWKLGDRVRVTIDGASAEARVEGTSPNARHLFLRFPSGTIVPGGKKFDHLIAVTQDADGRWREVNTGMPVTLGTV